jgi:hypothetical protein
VFAPCIAQAQIYTCMAEDGSRVYSNRKCGADAIIVKGYERVKPSRPKSSLNKQKSDDKQSIKPTPKSPEELALLLRSCNDGDNAACSQWSLGGGPNALRLAEEKAERDCEAGSLAACEERYCKEGANEECRQSVLRTALLSGDTWYLHAEQALDRDSSTSFVIRCVHKGVSTTRDVNFTCARGGRKCGGAAGTAKFERLTDAATSSCAKQ